MPKTQLQLTNAVLALIGEQSLLSSTSGSLAAIATDAINTAITNVAQETRANIFETTLQTNVTDTNYLDAAYVLPASVLQVYTVSLRQSIGSSYGDNLIQLEFQPLESLPSVPSYCVVGSNLFVSPTIARPCSLYIRALQGTQLPGVDGTDSGLPDLVIPAVQHTAASILALSYLDDPDQAAIQQKIAQALLDKLKSQTGVARAKAFNITGGARNTNGFANGGLNPGISAVVYAPLASPAFTGTPTAPTATTGDNTTQIATDAFVQNSLAGYLTIAAAAATYLTTATAASTYATLASLSSYLTTAAASATYATISSLSSYLTTATATATYLTQTAAAATYATISSLASYLTTSVAASTYAPLASPSLTGTPSAPTAATGTSTTQLATTAFVKGDTSWTLVSLSTPWSNFGSGYRSLSYAKYGDGLVKVSGVIACSSTPTGVIFTLPTGYRPSGQIIINAPAGFSSTTLVVSLYITTTGAVTWLGSSGSPTSLVYLSLEFEFSTL